MQIGGKGGVLIAGNATRDAEYKLVGSKQSPMCKFGMAIGRDAEDKPIYANVKAWRALAEYAAGITKGTPVMVAGHIVEREYNGETYREVEADYLVYLDRDPARGFVQVTDDPGLPEGFRDDGELPF